jgi:hypothetical protein
VTEKSNLPFHRCHACSRECNVAFIACPECGASFETPEQQAADDKVLSELQRGRDDEQRRERDRGREEQAALAASLTDEENRVFDDSGMHRRRFRRPPSGPLVTDSNYRSGTMLSVVGGLVAFIGLALATTEHRDKAMVVGPVGLVLFIAGLLWNLFSKSPGAGEP